MGIMITARLASDASVARCMVTMRVSPQMIVYPSYVPIDDTAGGRGQVTAYSMAANPPRALSVRLGPGGASATVRQETKRAWRICVRADRGDDVEVAELGSALLVADGKVLCKVPLVREGGWCARAFRDRSAPPSPDALVSWLLVEAPASGLASECGAISVTIPSEACELLRRVESQDASAVWMAIAYDRARAGELLVVEGVLCGRRGQCSVRLP
jgi:hypothetical protein